VDKSPKSQKDYYHNKIREFEKRTGINMNVKNVSKFYDFNIENAEYNTPAAINMMKTHGCYIYHDLLAEEDPRSNGTNWAKYGFAHVDGKIYKYYYETKQWGQEVKDFTHYESKNKSWKAAKLDKNGSPYLDPGEDYLPYAVDSEIFDSFGNKYIGSNFDDFAKENNIEFKPDITWALKMINHGKIVTRKGNPNIYLFPPDKYDNSKAIFTVEDLFAEDWVILPNRTIKDVLEDLNQGLTIRRRSWLPHLGVGKFAKSFTINYTDMLADDWEAVDVIAEVDQIQEEHKKG
jgi:hypothetical protein